MCCSTDFADDGDPSTCRTRMIANLVLHDFVAGPTPHDLLYCHHPHDDRKPARAVKEEMTRNVKEFLREIAILLGLVQGFD